MKGFISTGMFLENQADIHSTLYTDQHLIHAGTP